MDGFDFEKILHAAFFFGLWFALSGIAIYALVYAVQNFVLPIAPVLGFLAVLVIIIIGALLWYAFKDTQWNWWD
jgi:hypothetical protein